MFDFYLIYLRFPIFSSLISTIDSSLLHFFPTISILHFLFHYHFISFYSYNISIYILQNHLYSQFLNPIHISFPISLHLSISIISNESPLHFPFPQITLQIQNQLTNTSSISTNQTKSTNPIHSHSLTLLLSSCLLTNLL